MATQRQIEGVARLAEQWGIRLATEPVCAGHTSPAAFTAEWIFDRPMISLVHGPRGGGKSFLRGVASHIESISNPRHDTKILGGSLSQSLQIYEAIKFINDARPEHSAITSLTKTKAVYSTGSTISILAASPTQVRGPHVPLLCLDEVDEIDPEIRQQAVGMVMEIRGYKPSIAMTSTWHRISGPMAELVKTIPTRTFCAFEVLERCPEERSGPNLEHCPACPLVQWCHSDRDSHPSKLPKAKRSDGHYSIDSLIQKVDATSPRVFESDYLCLRPRAAGAWFTTFDSNLHVKADAEYNPHLPFHLAIDPGVHCGAVWFQVQSSWDHQFIGVNVFADHFAEGLSAQENAIAIKVMTETRCGVGVSRARVSMDPAGNARTAVGPTVRGEFEREGLKGRNGLEQWLQGGRHSKTDALQLVEALLMSANGHVSLTIHPRCLRLIAALQEYRRAKRQGQFMDWPEDPQHESGEDMIDPLCGGLKLEFPQGRTPQHNFQSRHAGSVV